MLSWASSKPMGLVLAVVEDLEHVPDYKAPAVAVNALA
jgi:hypothetical protein